MGIKDGWHICTVLEGLAVGGWWGTKRGGTSVGHDRQGMTAGCMGCDSQGHCDMMGRTCGHNGRGMMVGCMQV